MNRRAFLSLVAAAPVGAVAAVVPRPASSFSSTDIAPRTMRGWQAPVYREVDVAPYMREIITATRQIPSHVEIVASEFQSSAPNREEKSRPSETSRHQVTAQLEMALN